MSLGSIGYAVRTAWSAFRHALSSDPVAAGFGPGGGSGRAGAADSWDLWPSRRARYGLYWGLWENDVYEEAAGRVTRSIRSERGMYRHTRSLYNPAYRITEFYATRLMGGTLDRDASDDADKSALPIETENEAIRAGIARLWRDSKWEAQKELYCRYGAMLGDVGLILDDDPDAGRACMRVVHPGTIAWVGRDRSRRITGYTLEERRIDPRPGQGPVPGDPNAAEWTPPMVIYTEEARLDGDGPNARVYYRTYLDGDLYDWSDDGRGYEYDVDIPFVPLVLCQHASVGRKWGMNSFHTMLSRGFELDDMASGLSDQIRKAIRAPHLVSGMRAPGSRPTSATDPAASIRRRDVDDATAEGERDDLDYLWTPSKDVRATSLVPAIDIVGVCGHIRDLVADYEKCKVELLADVSTASGDGSGRALIEARKRATSLVQVRRASYDEALVMAQEMGLAIGGERGYDGYGTGLNFAAYLAGSLEHQIGRRPVFEIDSGDALNEDGQFWANANSAMAAGYPLEMFLEDNGWGEDRIAEYLKKKARIDAQAVAVAGHIGDVPGMNAPQSKPKSLSSLAEARPVGPEE